LLLGGINAEPSHAGWLQSAAIAWVVLSVGDSSSVLDEQACANISSATHEILAARSKGGFTRQPLDLGMPGMD
jgi:hypothetical protein